MSNSPPMALGFEEQRRFRKLLLRWFAAHCRDLPWRETRDPYRIWLSEIMLQQTRVGAVLEHYAEFLRRFPDLNSLAAARESAVVAAWSGLGYYRRARALHKAARIVVRQHEGKIPRNPDDLLQLPGIGRYTAAAIASIAFAEPCAVVDGNVERVLRRVFHWPQQSLARVWDAAQALLSRRSPGNFNQALMELGALVCLPVRPQCDRCPVRSLCVTIQRSRESGQDFSARRWTAKPPRKAAETTYALATRDGGVYLVRRGQHEQLMPGMWELPRISHDHAPPDFTLRHSITVTDHTAHVRRICPPGLRGGRWFLLGEVPTLPLTGLARRILRHAALI